jgi:RNA polymerase sigma-70 factor (ECF subfamily)
MHVQAADPADTDWPQIAALYDSLLRHTPTPIVALNRAVALGMACGAEAGLLALDDPTLQEALRQYTPFHLARADLLQRLGRADEARRAYVAALAHCRNTVQHAAITRRMETL